MKNEIEIDGVKYVQKDSVTGKRESIKQKQYVIARTYSAGVFAGYLKKREGKEVTLQDSRRIWYWKGACSLSQLAMEGTKNPDECKFAMVVDEVLLTECIELIPCKAEAMGNIQGVKVWKND